jgi:hypothetical protein
MSAGADIRMATAMVEAERIQTERTAELMRRARERVEALNAYALRTKALARQVDAAASQLERDLALSLLLQHARVTP